MVDRDTVSPRCEGAAVPGEVRGEKTLLFGSDLNSGKWRQDLATGSLDNGWLEFTLLDFIINILHHELVLLKISSPL